MTSMIDDAEVIIPLNKYNPGTNQKISSHVTATAKSAVSPTSTYQPGTAPPAAQFHHVQAYQAHVDDAMQTSIV